MRGRLSDEGAADPRCELDKEDIVLNLQSESYQSRDIELSNGFIGLRVRGGATLTSDTVNISAIKNDALHCWNGGVSIESLIIDHSLPIEYSDDNHPDCGQFFAKKLANDPEGREDVFEGLYIGSAKCNVACHGDEDKKNGFLFTELCKYNNIILFPRGIEFITNSSAPYFIDATNLNNAIIGSQDHPIDPDKVSGKGIRIGDVKEGAPTSSNITIHAYKGLNIVLGKQAKEVTHVIEYDKPVAKEAKPVLNTSKNMTPFMVGQTQQGQKEIKGSEDNPVIVEYFKATSYHASDDETRWCSAAHCWVHAQAGQAHTKSAAALSWKDWGVPINKPVYGCTIVGDRGNGRGHVGFYVGETDDSYIIMGGNQSDAYGVNHYPKTGMSSWHFRKSKRAVNSKTNWASGGVGGAGALVAGKSATELIPEEVEKTEAPAAQINQESPVQCNVELCPVSIPEDMTLIPTSLYEAGLAGGLTLIAIAIFIVYERLKKINNFGI